MLLLFLLFNYSILLFLHKPTAYTARTEISKRLTGLLANISVHIAKFIFQLHSLFHTFPVLKLALKLFTTKYFRAKREFPMEMSFSFIHPLTDQAGLNVSQVTVSTSHQINALEL